jgi:hypothetical protein
MDSFIFLLFRDTIERGVVQQAAAGEDIQKQLFRKILLAWPSVVKIKIQESWPIKNHGMGTTGGGVHALCSF